MSRSPDTCDKVLHWNLKGSADQKKLVCDLLYPKSPVLSENITICRILSDHTIRTIVLLEKGYDRITRLGKNFVSDAVY